MEKMIKVFGKYFVFVSWHKFWKGIYLHFIPRYCIRIFLWGIDWHKKPQPTEGER